MIEDINKLRKFVSEVYRWLRVCYLVPERKLFKAVISSKARNLIILLILNFKISPYARNDKKRGFSFRHYLGESSAEDRPRWPVIQVHPKLADFAVPAWKEFEEKYPIDKLLSPLNPARKDLGDILVAHGLYGAQLRYKLHLVEMTAASVSEFTGWKRKFIGIIDNIIDSLGPTGIAGALKELKDALTGSLPNE